MLMHTAPAINGATRVKARRMSSKVKVARILVKGEICQD